MVTAYFIGILFILATTAVFLPLLLAGHLGHEAHKKEIHHFHFMDKLRIDEEKCPDCSNRSASLALVPESVA